jgi:carbonic anhydrase
MVKRALLTATVMGLLVGSEVQWGYFGPTGPTHWGDLSPDYIFCKIGKNQSPIDISSPISAPLPMLNLYYPAGATSIVNNGHTIKVTPAPGGRLFIDGKEFKLLQFHFHTPSEHSINRKLYPMEMHLVHKSGDGELAVIGVLFKEGRENPALATLLRHFPVGVNNPRSLQQVQFNLNQLLPSDLSYYRYNGSLTTPPCTEGVRWFVLKTPVEASKLQILQFKEVMKQNNRPVQPLNARLILE